MYIMVVVKSCCGQIFFKKNNIRELPIELSTKALKEGWIVGLILLQENFIVKAH